VELPAGASTDGGEPDLAARAVDTLDGVIDLVRNRAVRPVVLVARAVVFGLIALTLVLVAMAALGIGLVRLLDVEVFGGRVWAADALIGVLACGVGAAAWSRRRPREVIK
jgi:hypothetical protein